MAQSANVEWPEWNVGECIGKGGYGAVYEIRREVFGDVERCALKVITIPKDACEIEYMRCDGMDDESITTTLHAQVGDIIREYKMMSWMRENPNIVHCDDFRYTRHEEDLGWDIYIKMELLTPLMKVLDRVQTEEQIIRLGKDMCNALMACQKYNIIHRDIKPQNIFLSPEGYFKLGDFGIARTMEHTTKATAGIGTYSFMAPEVAFGKTYGPTVDIYSLGLVLYWLLNERRSPFVPLPPAASTVAVNEEARARRYSGEQIPPPKFGSDGLKNVVLMACAFDPQQRYQTAWEMMDALNRLCVGRPATETTVRIFASEHEEEETVLSSGAKLVRNNFAESESERTDDVSLHHVRKTALKNCSVADFSDNAKIQYNARPKRRQARLCEKNSKKAGENFFRQPKTSLKLWLVIAICCVVLVSAVGIVFWRNAAQRNAVQLRQEVPPFAQYNTLPVNNTVAGTLEDPETVSEPWIHNVLSKNEDDIVNLLTPIYGSQIPRCQIVSATFLDTLADAPDISWDVSEAQNGSVLAWVQEEEGQEEQFDLYIAGDGGVNGELASACLFKSYSGLKEVNFNGNFHTENSIDFSMMFYNCDSLINLDVSGLDTSNVTDMSSMFNGCTSLTSLDVSGFCTSNVTNMHAMFYKCFSLTNLNIVGFDTSNVTSMDSMFNRCFGLTSLDVSKFDTSKVKYMGSMFYLCTNLTNLDVGGFDTSNVTDMSYMFYGCSCLTNLDISGFDTSKVKSYYLFMEDGKLIDGHSWKKKFE